MNEPAEVFAAGAMLAELHTALARGPQPPVLIAQNSSAPPGEQILEWLESQPPQADPETSRVLRDLVLAADPELPGRQIVHGDYRSANRLMDHGRVTGVLDFEEARWDHAVVELARQAVLLGTQYHDWGPVPASTREQLRAGYESIRPLTTAEASWWRPLVLWSTLLLTPTEDDPTGWGRSAREQITGQS